MIGGLKDKNNEILLVLLDLQRNGIFFQSFLQLFVDSTLLYFFPQSTFVSICKRCAGLCSRWTLSSLTTKSEIRHLDTKAQH
jgi:hypothetical protein